MAQTARIHPGKRKANPEQLSSARGRSAVGKNKEKARYLKEIERRFA